MVTTRLRSKAPFVKSNYGGNTIDVPATEQKGPAMAKAAGAAGAPDPTPMQRLEELLEKPDPTPMQRLEELLEKRASDTISKSSIKTYKRTYDAYVDFCVRSRLPDPLAADTISHQTLAAFLWEKSRKAHNARTWKSWQSNVISFSTSFLKKPELTPQQEKFLRKQRSSCSKTVGVVTSTVDPAGETTLRVIHERAAPHTMGLRYYMIFLQLVIAKECTTRPGELCDTGNGRNEDRLRASDVTFIEPDKTAGTPACIKLTLRNTKAVKLTGENKEKGERTFAAASGDALCPVKAMRFIFETYGLYNPLRADEPVFASMRADGSRYYAHPESSTGATMITNRELNEGIAELCGRAKIDRFTARATRHGQSSDLDAAGASDPLANVAGRWKAGSRKPYSHMTADAATAIRHLFNNRRSRIMAATTSGR